MNNNASKKVESLLKSRRLKKKDIYDMLELSASGFNYKLENDTFSYEELQTIANYFDLELSYFLQTDNKVSSKSLSKIESLDSTIREIFEDQIKVKDRQIERLQNMLEYAMMGKLQVSVFPHVGTGGVPLLNLKKFFLSDSANVYANSTITV